MTHRDAFLARWANLTADMADLGEEFAESVDSLLRGHEKEDSEYAINLRVINMQYAQALLLAWGGVCPPNWAIDGDPQSMGEKIRMRGDELQAENARLATEVAELKERQEWRNIETAPKDRNILIVGGKTSLDDGYEGTIDHPVIAAWWRGAWKSHSMRTNEVCFPTHWKPLPDPPEVSS